MSDVGWRATVLLLGLAGLSSTSDERRQEAYDELKGTWEVVSVSRRGTVITVKDTVVTFLGHKGHVDVQSEHPFPLLPIRKATFAFTLDPTTSPKQIDIRLVTLENRNVSENVEGEKAKYLGIYSLDGDRLEMSCNEEKRPMDFCVNNTSENYLYILRRQKK